MGIGALIGGIGSAVSGLFGASAAKDASKAQAQAQQQAIALQQQMFQQTQKNLAPFIGFGTTEMGQLQNQLPGLTTAFQPTQAQLESTPGYQFTLNQGLKALQNNYSAQGLGGTSSVWGQPGADGTLSSSGPQGPSGALGKALAQYTTGLADQTFQQQFANYWGQNQNIFNMLNSPTTLGANAAAGLGTTSSNVANSISSGLGAMGNAQAAGILGSTQAINQGISGITSNAQMALLANQMNGGQGGGGLASLFGGGNSIAGSNSMLGPNMNWNY